MDAVQKLRKQKDAIGLNRIVESVISMSSENELVRNVDWLKGLPFLMMMLVVGNVNT